jgi:hypothetical protein
MLELSASSSLIPLASLPTGGVHGSTVALRDAEETTSGSLNACLLFALAEERRGK